MFLCRGELPEVSKLRLKNYVLFNFQNFYVYIRATTELFFKIRLLKDLTILLFIKHMAEIKDDFLFTLYH
jgi:hypothetical protein